jgi:Flp pilus assembly protein TadG
MRYCPKQRRKRRAVAAAELALLLPVLTVLLAAAVDLGRLFYAYDTVTNCARNGALWACNPSTNGTVSPSQSPYATVTAAATADASNLSPTPTVDAPKYSATATGTYSTTYLSSGYVQVTVRWTFTPLLNYPGIPTKLSSTVTMRMMPAS